MIKWGSGVYDTDWATAGGWRLIEVFEHHADAERFIREQPKSGTISYDIKKAPLPTVKEPT